MAITGNLEIRNKLIHTESLDLTTPREWFENAVFTITSGTESSQMDQIWHDQRTLAASTAEDLDLAGSLVDAFGTTLTFVDIRFIMVKASSANTNDVRVGGTGANAFFSFLGSNTDYIKVKPGGALFLYTPTDPGYAVTAGTADLLQIENDSSGSTVTYDIYIGGVSA